MFAVVGDRRSASERPKDTEAELAEVCLREKSGERAEECGFSKLCSLVCSLVEIVLIFSIYMNGKNGVYRQSIYS